MSERQFHKDLRMFLMQLSIYSYEGRDPFAKGLCADALASIPQWISVEERLPEEGVDVLWLVEAYGEGTLYKIGCRHEDNIHADDGIRYQITRQAHWQPLPEPPEVK